MKKILRKFVAFVMQFSQIWCTMVSEVERSPSCFSLYEMEGTTMENLDASLQQAIRRLNTAVTVGTWSAVFLVAGVVAAISRYKKKRQL